MSGQIIFFKKNKADHDNPNILATASQGNLYAPYVLNRSNNSGWVTTGSVDADNTTLTIDMVDQFRLTDLLLVKHNFKNFTVKYWNGSSYVDFSPAINVTNNTASVNRYQVAAVVTQKVQITITGTQVANSDKFLSQFILTEMVGQLNGWPLIQKPTFDKNLRSNRMLSGKRFIAENLGAFACDLRVNVWRDSADLGIVETLFGSSEGFLTWLCGGIQGQFSSVRQGYRLEDIFLMKCQNSYVPEFYEGIYSNGLSITLSLAEVTV